METSASKKTRIDIEENDIVHLTHVHKLLGSIIAAGGSGNHNVELEISSKNNKSENASTRTEGAVAVEKASDKSDKETNEEFLKCPEAWRHNLLTLYFSEREISTKVKELAHVISNDYKKILGTGPDGEPEDLIVVGLLSGAVSFTTDLIRSLEIPNVIDWMKVSSYGKHTESRGSVVLEKDLSIDPSGKHILISEDLIDTGNTLKWLKTFFETKNCKSVRIACLLDKKARRLSSNSGIVIDYVGFECPDAFIVGYGM